MANVITEFAVVIAHVRIFWCHDLQKSKAPKKTYGRPISQQSGEVKKTRTTKGAQNQKTVKQLLGELYADKEYLENLLKETGSAAFIYSTATE